MMKKGSKAAKEWGKKMKSLRNKTKRKSSTKKGQVRKTARRAYETKRKASTKRRKTAKINKTTSKRKSMAKKRRSYSRSAKSGITNVFKSGVLGKAVAGIGAASILGLVVNQVAPQFQPISSVAGGYLGGGAVGAIAALMINGGLGNLGNLFGGSTNVTAQQEFGV